MDPRHGARAAMLLAIALTVTSCADSEGSLAPVLTTSTALEDDARQLWTSDATWTRSLIVSTVFGLDDVPYATQRLVENARDIGDGFRPYYGGDAAYRVTALLTDRATATSELLDAAMRADNAGLEAATTFAYANADALARLLADLNEHWDYYDLYRVLSAQLDSIVAETMAHVSGDFEASIAAHDAAVRGAREIADVFAEGTALERPDLVSTASFRSLSEEQLHAPMRVLWHDHQSWERYYVMDTLAQLPSAPTTTARLLENQADIGDSVRQIYGGTAADQLTTLLDAHVVLLGDVLDAMRAGETAEAGLAQQRWYANAREIAQLLASLLGSSAADLETMLDEHLDQSTEQALARAHGEWDRDVAAYDASVAHILQFADVLSAGIADDLETRTPISR